MRHAIHSLSLPRMPSTPFHSPISRLRARPYAGCLARATFPNRPSRGACANAEASRDAGSIVFGARGRSRAPCDVSAAAVGPCSPRRSLHGCITRAHAQIKQLPRCNSLSRTAALQSSAEPWQSPSVPPAPRAPSKSAHAIERHQPCRQCRRRHRHDGQTAAAGAGGAARGDRLPAPRPARDCLPLLHPHPTGHGRTGGAHASARIRRGVLSSRHVWRRFRLRGCPCCPLRAQNRAGCMPRCPCTCVPSPSPLIPHPLRPSTPVPRPRSSSCACAGGMQRPGTPKRCARSGQRVMRSTRRCRSGGVRRRGPRWARSLVRGEGRLRHDGGGAGRPSNRRGSDGASM